MAQFGNNHLEGGQLNVHANSGDYDSHDSLWSFEILKLYNVDLEIEKWKWTN